jgi:hypothetical protein
MKDGMDQLVIICYVLIIVTRRVYVIMELVYVIKCGVENLAVFKHVRMVVVGTDNVLKVIVCVREDSFWMIVVRGMCLEARYILMVLIDVMKVGQVCNVMKNYVLTIATIGEYVIMAHAIV